MATSDNTIYTLQRRKACMYLRMKQDPLSSCLLLHFHNFIMDRLNAVDIVKKFVCAHFKVAVINFGYLLTFELLKCHISLLKADQTKFDKVRFCT